MPWQRLIDLVLPRRCVGCRLSGSYICNSCLAALPPALETEAAGTSALFEYRDPRIKRLIWQLKYRGITAIADIFGVLLYQNLLESLADWQSYHPATTEQWLVIPLPLSPERRRSRGYNQAELLARALVKTAPSILKLESGLLEKIKNTPTQVSIKNRSQRLQNLKGAFAITKPELVRGRRLILVDDVITTGGTMSEARRVLKAAGARTVLAIAIAHG